ncbi:MAG: hypothetical protein ABIO70_30625 [Pseudomonadota bacterium]
MRALPLFSLLLVLGWPAPTLALDWWAVDASRAADLQVSLDHLWPEHPVQVRVGPPPPEGDAVWVEADELVLRTAEGVRREVEVDSVPTQVALVRSWLEPELILAIPSPPRPPPPALLEGGPRGALQGGWLLPGAWSTTGLNLSVGGGPTAVAYVDSDQRSSVGLTPVIAVAAGHGRWRANATGASTWTPGLERGPIGVVGVGFLVVDREEYRLAPWLGGMFGWNQGGDFQSRTIDSLLGEATAVGFGGVGGVGIAGEGKYRATTFDFSFPIVGVGFGQLDPTATAAGGVDARWWAAPRLLLLFPELGYSWNATDHDRLRVGILAKKPAVSWRHDRERAFFELGLVVGVDLLTGPDSGLELSAAGFGRAGAKL